MNKKKARTSKAAKAVRDLPAKTVSAKRGKGVKGGRPGGDKPVKYMEFKMNDVIITSVR